LFIPNITLSSLIPNILYVYNIDFSLFNTYKSIKEAAKTLNPYNEKLGVSLRGREIAIGRAKNKIKLVYTEKGSFYFAENPSTDR